MSIHGYGRRWALLICLLAPGCFGGGLDDAPDVVPVKGKVTRKGAPLAGVTVSFEPLDSKTENVSGSTGFTNENGEYELVYNRNLNGAMVGKHRVRLSKDDGMSDTDDGVPAPDEIVIPEEQAIHEVTVPQEGLEGGAANFDLDF